MGRILDDISKWPIEKRRAKLEEVYLQRIGVPLNLDKPERFTEKVQWRKLYDDDTRRGKCVNKLTFKQYVRENLENGEKYIAPLVDVWHTPDDVDFTVLPTKCVIKSNCASEGRYSFVIEDMRRADISQMTEEIKKSWFDARYLNTNSFNNAYYGVKPCVIIEDYLFNPKEMDEYKLYCFSGNVKCLYRYSGHFEDGKNQYGHYPVGFYDSDWNYLDVTIGNFKKEEKKDKPYCFEEMKQIAEDLSKDFSFVRVDFFVTPARLYVAEMCFNPLTGLEPYHPDSFDFELGRLWDFPPQE